MTLALFLSGCGGDSKDLEPLPAMPDVSAWPTEFQAMVRSADKAARKGPKGIEGVARLGRLYYVNGFLDEAWSCFGILVERDAGNPRWFHFLASILAGYGYLEEAVPLWEHVIRVEPDFAVAHVRLGDAFLKLGRAEESEQCLQDALKRFPEQPYVLSGLGRLAVDRSNWDEARGYLERASRASRFRTGVDLLATVYEQLGQPELAADLKREAGFGQFIDMRDPWMDALLVSCYDADRLANAGGQLNFYGDPAGGIRLLQRAASLAPKDAIIHYQLGQISLENGEHALAMKHLRRSVQLNPKLSDGWLRLVTLYDRLGRPAEAENMLSRGLQNCPDSPSLHLENGQRLRQAGLHREAIEEYRIAARLRPNEARAFLFLSTLFFSTDRYEEGLEAITQALKAEPGNPVALSTLAYYHIQMKHRTEAESWVQAVRDHPRIDRNDVDRLQEAFDAAFP